MTKAIQVTATGTSAANLYAMILAALSVTQLPQRVDLGDVFFPDFVAQVSFVAPSGNLTIEDQNGNEMLYVASGATGSIGEGTINCISLQALQLKSANSVTTNVSIIQV